MNWVIGVNRDISGNQNLPNENLQLVHVLATTIANFQRHYKIFDGDMMSSNFNVMSDNL